MSAKYAGHPEEYMSHGTYGAYFPVVPAEYTGKMPVLLSLSVYSVCSVVEKSIRGSDHDRHGSRVTVHDRRGSRVT